MNRTQQAKAAIARQRELDKAALAKAVHEAEFVPPLTEAAGEPTTVVKHGLLGIPDEKPRYWGDQRLPMEKTNSQRLPGGSRFDAVYDAEKKRWTGSLTINLNWLGDNTMTFKDDSGAVMKLLKKLDAQYRAWLKENQVRKDAPGPTENA